MMLYWDYFSKECETSGALAPERTNLPYHIQFSGSPFRSGNYVDKWRAVESGYITKPSDCPPIRLIGHYAFIVKCPGNVAVRRTESRSKTRVFREGYVSYGITEIEGDDWPHSDSGLIASWILGSEFVKIQTGINVYFPRNYYLYQGPLPNPSLITVPQHLEVMAGLEFFVPTRMTIINGEEYGVANLNVIARVPRIGISLELRAGDSLLWFFPALLLNDIDLSPLPKVLD